MYYCVYNTWIFFFISKYLITRVSIFMVKQCQLLLFLNKTCYFQHDEVNTASWLQYTVSSVTFQITKLLLAVTSVSGFRDQTLYLLNFLVIFSHVLVNLLLEFTLTYDIFLILLAPFCTYWKKYISTAAYGFCTHGKYNIITSAYGYHMYIKQKHHYSCMCPLNTWKILFHYSYRWFLYIYKVLLSCIWFLYVYKIKYC